MEKESNRGYWNTQVVSHPLSLTEKILEITGFILVIAISFGAMLIIFIG